MTDIANKISDEAVLAGARVLDPEAFAATEVNQPYWEGNRKKARRVARAGEGRARLDRGEVMAMIVEDEPPYYDRSGVVIYLGDSRDVLSSLGRESVDLIVTDPPYGVSFVSGQRAVSFGSVQGDDDAAFVPAVLSLAGRALRRNRHAYVFGRPALDPFPLRWRAELVWDKGLMGGGDLTSPWGPMHEPITFCLRAADKSHANMEGGKTPARLRSGSVLRYQRPNAKQVKRHPMEKPVPLLRRLIESSSFHGELVLDPFCGSGSTLVAAVAEGRRAVGIEVDERWALVAVERVDAAISAMESAAPHLV